MNEQKPSQALAICSLILPGIPTLAALIWLISAIVLGNTGDSGTVFYGSIIAMVILAFVAPVCSVAGILCGAYGLKKGQKKGMCVIGLVLSFLWLIIGGLIARVFLQ